EKLVMQNRFFTRNSAQRTALLLIVTLILSSFSVFAQERKDEKKKKNDKAGKESVKSVYKRWKDEDVRWIITDEERKTFDALKTDDEREQFIEQFWLRRDPDPDTDTNEYR